MNDPVNPFDPPKAPIEPTPSPRDTLGLVGGGRRFVNSLVDSIVLWVLFVVLAQLIALGTTPGPRPVADGCSHGLFNMLVNILYFTGFEYCLGRTPGKFLTGTVVVNEQGLRPSLGQVLGRTFARFIPFEFVSFFGAEARGWHDSLSKTLVVSVQG